MAGAKINNYSTIDNNIEELELTVDKCFNDRLTLTEMATTTVPEIAAGSRVEVGGAFFKFDSNEAISTTDPVTGTTVADGTVYVMLKPAVDGLSITAVFTATAPTWSDAKQGWYGTSTYAGYKYAGNNYCNYFSITKATTLYSGKHVISYNYNILTLSGSLTAGGSTATSIAYPDGFTIDNTMIISLITGQASSLFESIGSWSAGGSYPTGIRISHVTLTGTINIYTYGDTYEGYIYKITLMKV
jgi:hypothetical protein